MSEHVLKAHAPLRSMYIQGRRKLPKGGTAVLLDQSGDAAKGSSIEGHRDDNSARSAEKVFCLHFQLSGWALVALSYFVD